MNQHTSTAASLQNEEAGLGTPLPVKYSRITRFEGQPRRYFDPQGLQELADSIQNDEQETPVKVCRNSQKPGHFVIIDGERRWRAFGIIKDRTTSDPNILCFIDVVHDEKHHFRKAFVANLEREDLIPLDEAAAYQRLYDDSAARSHGAKVAEIASLARKSESHIENYLAVHTLPDAVKELMDPSRSKHERLSITTAVDIAKSTKNEALQLTLAREAVDRDLNTAEMRTLISIKTGNSGYGIRGRLRKPSDDYKLLKTFIGRTKTTVARMSKNLDIDALYSSRDDEYGDREYDAKVLKNAIGEMQDLLKKIEGETPKR